MVTQLETKNITKPDVSNLVTEDDTPVDNFGSEKQQRLLTSILYSARKEQIFLAAANVGIYHNIGQPPIVPDFFLSLDVVTPKNWWGKAHRCYLMWEFGKPPEIALEIVSNQKGEELTKKLKIYERMRVTYYVIFDPGQYLGDEILKIFELRGVKYVETTEKWLEGVNLGLTLWKGEFEGANNLWLRWCEKNGDLLLTGDESYAIAQQKAQQAENKLQRLKALLAAQGIDLEES